MLFQKLNEPDRTKTQLAYAAQYLYEPEAPYNTESLIVWSRKNHMRKGTLMQYLNEDMTAILYRNQEFAIKWHYNSIPTQLEWERKSLGYIIQCEFRVVKGIGNIALISF